MRKFIIAGLLLSGCGAPQTTWNGDARLCDHIVEGACVNGISVEMVQENLSRARKLFGAFDVSGYMISTQDKPIQCGYIDDAAGCWDGIDKTVIIQTNSVYCEDFLLVHEFGHIAIHDGQHKDYRWGVLINTGHSNGECFDLPAEE